MKVLLLEFAVAFPGEQPRRPEEYLMGGNRDLVLNAASFFLGFKNRDSRYVNNRDLLGMFFRQENRDFATAVHERIRIQERQGRQVQIINPYTSLKLFETFFQIVDNDVTQTPQEFEINLFKAYLVLNSNFTSRQMAATTSTTELEEELKIPMLFFCMSYVASDVTNYDLSELWITQTIKTIYLFQFLERDARTQRLLAAFLTHFECRSWEEYLKRLLPLTAPAIKSEREAHTDIILTGDEQYEAACTFIEKFIVPINEPLLESDFLSLRSKPLYKIEDGKYRIIFSLFVLEKIFKGMYFILRDINTSLPADEKITDLKSLFGADFAENTLCSEVIKIIYPDNCVRYSGEELAAMGIQGAPDSYVRKAKNILLIESKDFLIPAPVKESCDYSQYENEFEKKLYFMVDRRGVEMPKAIMQLIGTIRRVLRKEFEADKRYHYRDVTIYPVLLTHEHQYNVAGFNELLNYWFQAELELLQEEGFYIRGVRPLVVVNIDSLIYHQVALQKEIPLHEVLNKYLEHTHIAPGIMFPTEAEAQKHVMSKMDPFSIFIHNYFTDLGFREFPPMLNELGLTIFKEERENSDQ